MEDKVAPNVVEKPRTLARRRQVLDAAAHCFRLHGFHACSMAQISSEAGMSVGHIYRYFPGKDAIIAAIVQRNVEEAVANIAALAEETGDLRAILIERATEGVMKAADADEAALMIEIRAEAARNPAIQAVVRHADQQISAALRIIMAKAVGRELSPADLDARVEMFHLIFQGVGLRVVINPDTDLQKLAQLIKLSLSTLLK